MIIELITHINEYRAREDFGDLSTATEDRVLQRLLQYHVQGCYTGIVEIAALSNILGTNISIFLPDSSDQALTLSPNVLKNPKPLRLFWCIGDETYARELAKRPPQGKFSKRKIQDEECQEKL